MQVAVFGEAEKGRFHIPYLCRSLEELLTYLGHPIHDTHGILLAIQTILYGYEALYFRVEQEGFSTKDYFYGLKYLEEKEKSIAALGIPGVGDKTIIDATKQICNTHQCFLISSEKDLYDLLTR